MKKILSPVVLGTGVFSVHEHLQRHLPCYRLTTYPPWYEFFPLLLKTIDTSEAEVLHTTPDHAAFLATKQRDLVITFHNYFLDRTYRRQGSFGRQLHYATDLRLFTRIAMRRACFITAVSKSTADIVSSDMQLGRKIIVIENGVDCDRFKPGLMENREVIRVLFSGKLSERKGSELIFALAERAPRNFLFFITRDLPNSRPAPPNIHFIGRKSASEMPRLYRKMDILLLPSRREGASLAILEAMASGLPIIASDIPSNAALVQHEKGGFLCSLERPSDWLRCLKQFDCSQLREDFGYNNRLRALEHFPLEKMIKGYREVFDSFG